MANDSHCTLHSRKYIVNILFRHSDPKLDKKKNIN